MENISFLDGTFRLTTKNSTWLMRTLDTGHLSHIYWGKRFDGGDGFTSLISSPGKVQTSCTVSYDEEHFALSMANEMLECSAPGKGDTNLHSVAVRYGNGLTTLDFIYDHHEIVKGRPDAERPRAYAGRSEAETLIITMKDRVLPIWLDLEWSVFPDTDMIVRTARMKNGTDGTVRLERLSSMMLDLPDTEWDLITLNGAWGREKEETRRPLSIGRIENSTSSGFSSNNADPWICLARPETTDSSGECIASSLIWSGAHEETVEVTPWNRVRIISGVSSEMFSCPLGEGESFRTPDAIITWSGEGIGKTSRNMQRFIMDHVVRSVWKHEERPILLNNWEATYFAFTEKKLHQLIDTAADLGMELFVLDDGWFGKRDSDRSGLGDWTVNREKLPGGLSGLSAYAHERGLKFGIWTEPEMISFDSDLYRAHPDWTVAIPGRAPSNGRHQYLLDLTRKDVRRYLLDSLSEMIEDDGVDYMKWDMNRIMSDICPTDGSDAGAFMYRYIESLYSLLGELTDRFPSLLLESCASGGNRYDIGMLAFSPQIWTSDDTDAYMRTGIERGTLRWSPQSAMGSHVSAVPNHQTGRVTDIETRFDIAAMGVLGYELDVTALSDEEKEKVKAQTAFYRKWRRLLQYGEGSFLETRDGNLMHYAVTDGESVIAVCFQKLNRVNTGRCEHLVLPMAKDGVLYRITERTTDPSVWSLTVPGSILRGPGIEIPPCGGAERKGPARKHGDHSSSMFIAQIVG